MARSFTFKFLERLFMKTVYRVRYVEGTKSSSHKDFEGESAHEDALAHQKGFNDEIAGFRLRDPKRFCDVYAESPVEMEIEEKTEVVQKVEQKKLTEEQSQTIEFW